MERATDPETRYSKIRTRLKDVDQALRQTGQELNSTQKPNDDALGTNYKVVVRGIPESFLKEVKHEEVAVGYHLANLLQKVDEPEHGAFKALLHLRR